VTRGPKSRSSKDLNAEHEHVQVGDGAEGFGSASWPEAPLVIELRAVAADGSESQTAGTETIGETRKGR
jgi:hypothetical protein